MACIPASDFAATEYLLTYCPVALPLELQSPTRDTACDEVWPNIRSTSSWPLVPGQVI